VRHHHREQQHADEQQSSHDPIPRFFLTRLKSLRRRMCRCLRLFSHQLIPSNL
jgi:hypothetical protein